MEAQSKTTAELRLERRRTPTTTSDLIIACLWPKRGDNLGTTLRTCDAVDARMVVPDNEPSRRAVRMGNTIGVHNSPVDFIVEPLAWLAHASQRARTIAVELAHDATPLRVLEPVAGPTLVVVGHESQGIPDEALRLCDEVVEIPMVGVGNSLNVSVAAALVLYKLRGWV